jgi:Xaa-Pro dipeptidase
MIDICRVQESLRRQRIDGWLFADFHDRDSLGLKLLGLQAKKISTRRWYYWIPANGRPVKIAHAIESHRLEALEGDTLLYAGREKLVAALSFVLGSGHTIAMQYSPYCNLPTISMVDAGTAELVKSIGNVLVSSADLVQEFEASLTAEQIASHVRASQKVHHVLAEIVKGISKYLDQGSPQTERQVQLQILDSFEAEGLTCDGSLPIVAVNEHAADPHFEVSPEASSLLQRGDRLLIDLWARENESHSMYYDIAWCYQLQTDPSEEYARLFSIAVSARKAACDLVKSRLASGAPLQGWEVDAAAREVISGQGLGEYFTHRTGHSIGEEVHGCGVNIDGFETRDERLVIPAICFSIEPGIYRDSIGVRTEVDILVDRNGVPNIYGPVQDQLIIL